MSYFAATGLSDMQVAISVLFFIALFAACAWGMTHKRKAERIPR